MIPASAAVLAGGDSKRMGQNKALLKIGNLTLLEIVVGKLRTIFRDIIIVTHLKEQFQGLALGKVTFVKDFPLGTKKSALRGIYACLSASKNDKTFVVACDMPFISPKLISFMSGFIGEYDIVIPKIGKHFQPLHGYYGKACLPIINEMLANDRFKIIELYERVKVKTIEENQIIKFDQEDNVFLNINNFSDYERALKIYQISSISKGDAHNASTRNNNG